MNFSFIEKRLNKIKELKEEISKNEYIIKPRYNTRCLWTVYKRILSDYEVSIELEFIGIFETIDEAKIAVEHLKKESILL